MKMEKEWIKKINCCNTEICEKQVGEVKLQLWKGINGAPCKLVILENPYFRVRNEYYLTEKSFEKAMVEADELYFRLISDCNSFMQKQLILIK